VTRRTALLLAAAAAMGLVAAAAVILTRHDARPVAAHASTAKATQVEDRFRLSSKE
jgi:hypothetical protein